MRSYFVIFLLTTGMTSLCAQEKTNHPYQSANIGDWIEYQMTIKGRSKDQVSTVKHTVAAKEEKQVTIQIDITGEDKTTLSTKRIIDLTKPYDPLSLLSDNKLKWELKKIDSGIATLTIDGKKYETSWTRNKGGYKIDGKTMDIENKVWLCKDAPLNGVVQLETFSNLHAVSFEAKGFGPKK
jgi:hypothetical protein